MEDTEKLSVTLQRLFNLTSQAYFTLIDATNGELVDPSKMTSKAVSNVMFSIVHGQRNDYDDDDFNAFLRDSDEACATISQSGIIVALPFLRSVCLYVYVCVCVDPPSCH